MRRNLALIKQLSVAAAILGAGLAVFPLWAGQSGQSAPSGQAQARPQRERPLTPAEMEGKTAGQVYKNLKVLQDIPANKLIDGMRYITVALGQECQFCHVRDNFPSDDKKNKITARKMMAMLFAIDKDNFNGRTEVTCYTCHQGHDKPMSVPAPEQAAAPEAPSLTMPPAKPIQPAAGTPIPTLDQLLAKYADALGGNDALGKITTRVMEVERSGEGGRPPATVEVYQKAPGKLLMVASMGQRQFRSGYNGAKVWAAFGPRARDLEGMEAIAAPREAQIDPVAALKQYKGLRLVAMAQIGDKKAYVVMGRAPDGNEERLFFDADSGLLVRRMIVYRTIFGPLLFQADYSDYRKADGVAIPYKTEWWEGGRGFTETVKSVKTNVPVADSQFEPPAMGGQPGARPGNGQGR